MPAPHVRPWSATPGELSEGPRWHAERGELLWVDILAGRLHRATVRADGTAGDIASTVFDRHVGAVAPVEGGGYLLAAAAGFLFLGDDGSITELAQPCRDRRDVRMNDAACDPQGRFWAGTMAYDESPGAGTLYRLDLDGRCTEQVTGLTVSNGIDWSPDGRTMYLADSGTRRIDAFDFDGATGAISGRRTLIEVDGANGVPDGLTVDAEGGIWVAFWDGFRVDRYSPDGTHSASVGLPVSRPTSCAFGGRQLDTLFVTSARIELDEAALTQQPGAGVVFAVDGLGVRGVPCRAYRGNP